MRDLASRRWVFKRKLLVENRVAGAVNAITCVPATEDFHSRQMPADGRPKIVLECSQQLCSYWKQSNIHQEGRKVSRAISSNTTLTNSKNGQAITTASDVVGSWGPVV